jgi:transcriptional regulator with XRE-family HTH domain
MITVLGIVHEIALDVDIGDSMKNLSQQRKARGWSKAEFGRRARLHPAREGPAESGRAVLYDVELARLAKALGWKGDPAALLEEVDDAPRQ